LIIYVTGLEGYDDRHTIDTSYLIDRSFEDHQKTNTSHSFNVLLISLFILTSLTLYSFPFGGEGRQAIRLVTL